MKQYLMAKTSHRIDANLGNRWLLPVLPAICASIWKILSHHSFDSELIGSSLKT